MFTGSVKVLVVQPTTATCTIALPVPAIAFAEGPDMPPLNVQPLAGGANVQLKVRLLRLALPPALLTNKLISVAGDKQLIVS